VENVNWRKEIAFAAAAAIVAFLVSAILRTNGAGKWLTAGASGAIGGLAAAAVIA
jgi:membrane associated rhomboid family serine protease